MTDSIAGESDTWREQARLRRMALGDQGAQHAQNSVPIQQRRPWWPQRAREQGKARPGEARPKKTRALERMASR